MVRAEATGLQTGQRLGMVKLLVPVKQSPAVDSGIFMIPPFSAAAKKTSAAGGTGLANEGHEDFPVHPLGRGDPDVMGRSCIRHPRVGQGDSMKPFGD